MIVIATVLSLLVGNAAADNITFVDKRATFAEGDVSHSTFNRLGKSDKFITCFEDRRRDAKYPAGICRLADAVADFDDLKFGNETEFAHLASHPKALPLYHYEGDDDFFQVIAYTAGERSEGPGRSVLAFIEKEGEIKYYDEQTFNEEPNDETVLLELDNTTTVACYSKGRGNEVFGCSLGRFDREGKRFRWGEFRPIPSRREGGDFHHAAITHLGFDRSVFGEFLVCAAEGADGVGYCHVGHLHHEEGRDELTIFFSGDREFNHEKTSEIAFAPIAKDVLAICFVNGEGNGEGTCSYGNITDVEINGTRFAGFEIIEGDRSEFAEHPVNGTAIKHLDGKIYGDAVVTCFSAFERGDDGVCEIGAANLKEVRLPHLEFQPESRAEFHPYPTYSINIEPVSEDQFIVCYDHAGPTPGGACSFGKVLK